MQLLLLDECFDLLLEVVAFRGFMLVAPVEVTVLIYGPFVQIALQLICSCQGHVITYLHEYLIQWNVQRDEVRHSPLL